MTESKYVKVVLFVPESHADSVREALGKAGAGKIGNYSHCSFSTKGIARFRPENGAHPAIGEVDVFESVVEERIETVCESARLNEVTREVKKVHPYEEVVLDIYPLLEL